MQILRPSLFSKPTAPAWSVVSSWNLTGWRGKEENRPLGPWTHSDHSPPARLRSSSSIAAPPRDLLAAHHFLRPRWHGGSPYPRFLSLSGLSSSPGSRSNQGFDFLIPRSSDSSVTEVRGPPRLDWMDASWDGDALRVSLGTPT